MHLSPSIVLLLLVLQCRYRQVSHHTELPRAISFVELSSCLRICTSDNFLAKIRSFKNTPLHQGRITVILLTLLLCGDVEPNPGPRNDPVYPCGCCERKVNWSHKAICCVGPHQMCSITQLRKELELQTLEERRLQQRLILSLIHISEPTRQAEISYAVFCLNL